MDLRIVNTCNNNCLYCLEQKLREKNPYLSLEILESELLKSNDNNITFYWWNPLLHPDLLKIITYSKQSWKDNIWLLSNTWNLDKILLENLIQNGLNNFGFYFYSFQELIHNSYSGKNITLKTLCNNIHLISQYDIYKKAVIHLHKWNIKNIAQDIIILHKNFWIKNFEFVNYLLVDRALKYKKLLEYNILNNRENIDELLIVIKELNIQVKFVRFNKDFFWKYQEYNDDK